MNEARRDGLLGAVVAVFAVAYTAQARAIEDSLLADAVGAGGVPQAAGIVLLGAALALICKAWLTRSTAVGGAAIGARQIALGAALVALLVVYVLLLPRLGYIASVSLLVGAIAWLAGARDRVAVGLCTALSGLAMWAMFEWALKIRMPAGSWFS